MKKMSIYSIVLIVIVSCGMKTHKLLDNRTRVPSVLNVYGNKSNFNESLLKLIDTTVIYEEYNERYNILARLDNHVETVAYRNYRFYPNGCFNLFYLHRNEVLNENDFNPEYNGYRGVYYKEEDKIRYDLFAEVDQQQNVGKLNATLVFKGDTLYVKRDKSRGYIEKYVKRKLPIEYLKYKADW